MIHLLSSARAALAAVALTGALSSGANAAIYEFTGSVSFQSEEVSYVFGCDAHDCSTFTAILDIDDSQTIADAAYSYLSRPNDFGVPYNISDSAIYNYTSFTWSLGSESWSFTGSYKDDRDFFYVVDGIAEGWGYDGAWDANDYFNISGGSDQELSGGTIFDSYIVGKNYDQDVSSGSGVSALGNWNTVADGPWWYNNFGYILTSAGDVSLSQIKLINVTSGIPEPATWLMMIMGFGLAGIASRRRAALAA